MLSEILKKAKFDMVSFGIKCCCVTQFCDLAVTVVFLKVLIH